MAAGSSGRSLTPRFFARNRKSQMGTVLIFNIMLFVVVVCASAPLLPAGGLL